MVHIFLPPNFMIWPNVYWSLQSLKFLGVPSGIPLEISIRVPLGLNPKISAGVLPEISSGVPLGISSRVSPKILAGAPSGIPHVALPGISSRGSPATSSAVLSEILAKFFQGFLLIAPYVLRICGTSVYFPSQFAF